jgi:hypothetical protein
LPEAEHALEVSVARALALIHAGNLPEARRALEVGISAAELLDSERETLARE